MPEQRRSRRSWSPDEDDELKDLMQDYKDKTGTDINQWKFISDKFNLNKSPNRYRCPDSCRKRWKNHLNTTIKKSKLSPDEKKEIAHLHKHLGNKWSDIAKKLSGRTSDQIKVYCNSSSRHPAPGTSSAGIIPQATSMLPSNQQTEESRHSIHRKALKAHPRDGSASSKFGRSPYHKSPAYSSAGSIGPSFKPANWRKRITAGTSVASNFGRSAFKPVTGENTHSIIPSRRWWSCTCASIIKE